MAKTVASFLLFWLGTIPGYIALFVTVVTDDLAEIIPFCTSRKFVITLGIWDTVF